MFSVGGMRTFFNRFGSGCALVLVLVFAIPLIVNFSSNQLGNRAMRNNPNASGDTEIATVNDQPITEAEFRQMQQSMAERQGSAAPGRAYAEQQGQVMQQLIKLAVVRQEAQRRNARPLDADIDRSIDQLRQAVAQHQNKAKLSDSEWDDFLSSRNLTGSDLREQTAKDLIPQALINNLKAEQKVTEAEARNQNAQVHLTLVQVPYQDPAMPSLLNQKTKLPTEAEAQKKANDLLAKVKAGANISQIAAANAPDAITAKTAGDMPNVPEYPTLGIQYGKDFAEAVHKLEKGQTSEVVKLTGRQHAFGFVRLVDRKINTPKDFDVKKAMAALAEQRANIQLGELVKSLTKAAKINFKDPDKKAYYDLAELDSANQPSIEDLMNAITPPMPDKAETEAKQAVVNKEFEDLAKRHPDDVNAMIIVADNLKADPKKMLEPGAQDRLIQMDEAILKLSDDQDRRFELATLYRDKKQYDKSKAQYDRIAKLLSYNPTYDTESMQAAATVHKKLEQGYRSINQSVEADKEKNTYDALQQKITLAKLKEAEEQRKNKTGTGITPNSSITLPPGGRATVPAGAGNPAPITITPSPDSTPTTPGSAPPASGVTPSAPSGSGLNLNLNPTGTPAGGTGASVPAATPSPNVPAAPSTTGSAPARPVPPSGGVKR